MNSYIKNAAKTGFSRLDWSFTILLFLSATVLYSVFIYRSRFSIDGQPWFSLCDDAMISMTYARNLANGDGLIWNRLGEAVEGYTNFGWTLIMALVHFLPLRDGLTSLVIMLFGIGTMLVTGYFVVKVAEECRLESIGRTAALVLTLCCFPLIFWSLRGLEVGLLACLSVMGAFYALKQRLVHLFWILPAMLLVRTDGALSAAALSLLAILCAPKEKKLFVTGSLFLTCAMTLGLHTFFRWMYYGDLLPNTYILKMTGTPLKVRVTAGWNALYAMRWQILPLLAVIPWAFFCVRYCRMILLWLTAAFLVQVAYSVYVGGDAWEQTGFLNRYITQGLPFLFIVSAAGIEAVARWLLNPLVINHVPKVAGAALATIIVGMTDSRFLTQWLTTNAFQVEQDGSVVRAAVQIGRATKPGAQVAVVWAGAIPYFSHRAGVDLLGKMDRHISHLPPRNLGWFYPGHMKWDYKYSLQKYKPDVIHELWFPAPPDLELVKNLGYQAAGMGKYYLERSELVDASALDKPVSN